MAEQDFLDGVAEKYRKDGYDVLVRPSPDDLPAFLADTQVDILARKRDHLVALQAKEQEASGANSIYQMAADMGAGYAASLLEEAELLLNPQTMRAALIMAWAALEAGARASLLPGKEAFAKSPPRKLIEELAATSLVTQEEAENLRAALRLRTLVVHGAGPDYLPPAAVSSVLEIARRLLGVEQGTQRPIIINPASLTLLRGRLNEWPTLKGLIERATNILGQLLGPSLGTVTVEWDLAEDGYGEAVAVLKLSDLTGTVTATFRPPELMDEEHVRSRLNRLWGDLLEIRSHKQVQHLLSATKD
jgi:hypothetical protein